MPSFQLPSGVATPFGRNEFLRSTEDVKTESYTLAASLWPSVTINTVTGQKVAQPGTILAKATSGPEEGKVGPYQPDSTVPPTNGLQTAANVVGILLTFLPWQLMDHDETVSVAYEASVVKDWLLYLKDGAFIAATGLTWSSTVGASSQCRFIVK